MIKGKFHMVRRRWVPFGEKTFYVCQFSIEGLLSAKLMTVLQFFSGMISGAHKYSL
jgi:hypothetical protein